MATAVIEPTTYSSHEAFRRFTVAEYQGLVRAGILDEDDHVELLEGCVVLKMPRNPQHDGTVEVVMSTLGPLLPQG